MQMGQEQGLLKPAIPVLQFPIPNHAPRPQALHIFPISLAHNLI